MVAEAGVAINQRKAWTIVALLFFYGVINFFDKLVLGLAAVPIMKELALTPAQYGLVASSFYWLYAVSGVLVGLLLVNRIKSKWLLILLVAIWSAAQAPIAFSSSLGALIACRIVLGIGEGPGTPSAYDACHSWFPSDRRNFPTAIIIQGTSVGFLVGAPILTHVILGYGWRSAFLLCSGLGVLWIVAWLMFGENGPISVHSSPAVTSTSPTEPPGPWMELWFDRTMIGNYIVGFGSYWIIGLSIAWMAPYLQQGLGYDGKAIGWMISAMTAGQPPIILGISYVSERMLRGGTSSRSARAIVNAACLILGGASLAIAMSIDAGGLAKVVLLAVGFLLPSITFVLGPAMVSEIAPTSQRGTALLVTYSVVTVAGFVSPVVMGYALQSAGPQALAAGYTNAFLITAAVLVAAGSAGLLLLNPDVSKRRLRAVARSDGAVLELAPRAA
jgi:MFS family permease